jgi:hypothetical protein
MPLPFLSGAQGDPIRLQRQVAAQAALGIPAIADFVDFLSNAGPMQPSPQEVQRLVVAAGGAPLPSLPGKTVVEGGLLDIGDIDPSNKGMLQFLANLYGQYLYIDNTTWHRWRFGLDEATAAAPFLTIHNDNDIIPRTRFKDVLMSGATITAAPNENFDIQFQAQVGNYDFFGAVSQEVGSGSDLPILERTFDGNWALDATDKDIYIRVDDASGAPVSVDVSVKVSSAAVYSATQTIILGQWNRLYDESGAIIGTWAEQPKVYWSTAASLTDTDEFKILKRKARWTPSLGVERPIASVNGSFFLNGEEKRVEGGFEIAAEWENAEVFQDTFQKQGGTPERSGLFRVTVTPTQRITDLDVQNAIHENLELSLVIDAQTDSEIVAGQPYRALMVFPAVKAYEPMYGAEPGATNREQAPTLIAGVPSATFNYGGMSFDTHSTIVIDNDLSDTAVFG